MTAATIRAWKHLATHLSRMVRQWTQPLTTGPVTSVLSDLTRTRADLVAENALLRHQLAILRRQTKRPRLTLADHIGLVLLARCARFWQQAPLIVQPDTLLRWHRDLFRRS